MGGLTYQAICLPCIVKNVRGLKDNSPPIVYRRGLVHPLHKTTTYISVLYSISCEVAARRESCFRNDKVHSSPVYDQVTGNR